MDVVGTVGVAVYTVGKLRFGIIAYCFAKEGMPQKTAAKFCHLIQIKANVFGAFININLQSEILIAVIFFVVIYSDFIIENIIKICRILAFYHFWRNGAKLLKQGRKIGRF